MLWDASIELSRYIQSCVLVRGKTVLELGAGMGLCGMVASLAGAERTVVTEKEPELQHLRESVKANVTSLVSSTEGLPRLGGLCCEELEWSQTERVKQIKRQHGPFDLVFAADCVSTDVYGKASWLALRDVLHDLSTAKTQIYICSTVRPNDGLTEFIQVLSERFSSIEVAYSGMY